MMKKKYLQPDSTLLTIAQEQFICASDLETNDSNGLEELIMDEIEGVWTI
ncbi:MAG: hypothetical protein K6E37_09065 [Bacteroidales bacterium]|nr:hypothetical protein [Bacteroidales bacterium]